EQPLMPSSLYARGRASLRGRRVMGPDPPDRISRTIWRCRTPGLGRREVSSQLRRQAEGFLDARAAPRRSVRLSLSLVAGARNQRYLRLVERQIPKLAA